MRKRPSLHPTQGSARFGCTTDKLRPNDADIMAPGSVGFTIPARSTFNWSCDYPWGSKVGVIGSSASYEKVHVFSAMPHMHKLGKSMKVEKYPASGGRPETVIDQPAYDFESQSTFPVDMDIQVGDTFKTRCGWNNTTDQPVTFGENTEQEMCFAFLAYYPKAVAPQWTWIAPAGAFTTTCQVAR